MCKVTIKTLLLLSSIAGAYAVAGVASAGGRGTYVPPSPTIVKTAIDAKESVLVITGRHFGTVTPTVTLADVVLDVKRFSEYEVVASLPRDLAPATYAVMVITNGPHRRTASNLFSATLPSLGKLKIP